MTPETLIGLANLGVPRRPAGARAQSGEPILADLATTRRQLGPLVKGRLTTADLPALRQVQHAAVHAVQAMLRGRRPAVSTLNALSRGSVGHLELRAVAGTVRSRLVWDEAPPAADLARRLIAELDAVDLTRLRRCARPECGLVFYDTTRSRTRRWHAEDPCGWRERQRHRRARPGQ